MKLSKLDVVVITILIVGISVGAFFSSSLRTKLLARDRVDDTTVFEGTPNTNYDGNNTIVAGTYKGERIIALVKFNHSGTKLTLDTASSVKGATVSVYSYDKSWTEGQITWDRVDLDSAKLLRRKTFRKPKNKVSFSVTGNSFLIMSNKKVSFWSEEEGKEYAPTLV